jgi:transposase
MWAEIGHHLTAPASDGEAREEARRAAQGVLWILRRGRAWSDLPASVAPAGLARRYWETWMADGRWLDFWGAFVARLGGDEWLGWSRALVRAGEEIAHAPGRGREAAARYAWWVVSARLLLWEARWVPAGSRPRRAG